MTEEPILEKSLTRFTTFPINYPSLWSLYKKAIASFWTTEEIDLSMDHNDWKKLSSQETFFIKHILAFFAGSDGIVMENLNINFASEVQIAEARSFYAYQEFNESIHGETYSLLIDTYVDDQEEKMKLFEAIETIPCIQKKAKWSMNWFDRSRPFAERLVAFACVEGIFFSGAFCSIYWLKKRGLMPGLCFSNELISRDEGLHCEFAVELFNHIVNKPSPETIKEIVRSAVALETEFICEALPCRLIGMNSDSMTAYIQFVADRLLKQFGVEKVFNSLNPYPWMEMISLEGKTSFFEKRVSEYSKHGVGSESGNSIAFDDDSF